MSRFSPARLVVWLAVAVMFTGCDPKLTGNEESTGNDGGGEGSDPPDNALLANASAAGALISMHFDLLQVAAAQSGSFDSGSVGRSIFTSDCVTAETINAGTPELALRMNSCVDSRGTSYRGGVRLFPIGEAADGYYFEPMTDVEDRIIATNESSSHLAHSFDSGNLQLTFQRDGSQAVNGITVGNFLRHLIGESVASFSYVDVRFDGAVGSHNEWPTSGGIVRVSWDGVGVFDVNLDGTSTAQFSLGGFQFEVNLVNGDTNVVLG